MKWSVMEELNLRALAEMIQTAMDDETSKGGMYAALTDDELEALSAAFRGWRQRCRKVMHNSWADKDVTESYRQMVVEFQHNDPLFTAEHNLREAIEK
jgi:hypothetical protein